MDKSKLPEKTRAVITVKGRVQGVGYRAFARAKAIPMMIRGYVKNMPGGTVKVVAEGSRKKIQKLVSQLQEGPALASIEDLNIAWEEFKGEFSDFEIKH